MLKFEINIKVMKFIIIGILSWLLVLSCKTEPKKANNEVIKEEVKAKKPLSALAERLYVNYTAEPQTQFQKDENALIDYAIDNEIDVTRTATGLYYAIDIEGVGPNYIHGQPCKAHYSGYFLDGKVFDSSYNKGKPLLFSVGQMNAAWNEALKLMNTGTKAKLLIPSKLAYGERGFPGYVAPNTPLIFDLEILPLEE